MVSEPYIERILLILGPLAMLVIGYSLVRYLFPALMFGGNYILHGEERKKVVEDVRSSGPPIASIRCAGQLGGVRITGPLMSVTVYPKGVTFSTFFSSQCAFRVDEIKTVIYNQSFWNRSIEIKHSSHNVSTPVFLRGIGKASDIANALNSIVGADRVSMHK